MYKVKVGETIGDVVLNACGSLSAWNDFLTLNNLSDWTYLPAVDEQFETPSIANVNAQKIFQSYPANNASDFSFFSDTFVQTFPYNLPFPLQGITHKNIFDAFLALLDAAPIGNYSPGGAAGPFINYYTVRTGETVTDICINSTGTVNNWETILNDNLFDTWTPVLTPNQKIILSNVEIQNNVLLDVTSYPANNATDTPNYMALIDAFIASL